MTRIVDEARRVGVVCLCIALGAGCRATTAAQNTTPVIEQPPTADILDFPQGRRQSLEAPFRQRAPYHNALVASCSDTTIDPTVTRARAAERLGLSWLDCDCVRQRSPADYVVVFRQGLRRFDYPAQNPVSGQEIVLCVDASAPQSRFRLTSGVSRTGQGQPSDRSTTVGFSPSRPSTTALRQVSTSANEPVTRCDALANGRDQDNCNRASAQVSALQRIVVDVARYRDHLATLVSELTNAPSSRSSLEAWLSIPRAICSNSGSTQPQDGGPPSHEVVVSLPARTTAPTGRQDGENRRIDDDPSIPRFQLPSDCSSAGQQIATIENYVEHRLVKDHVGIRWSDGSWYFEPTIDSRLQILDPDAGAPSGNGSNRNTSNNAPRTAQYESANPDAISVINDLRASRAELLTVLSGAMQAYSQLVSVVENSIADSAQRQMLFRVGVYDGGTIVSFQLDDLAPVVTLGERRDSLTYSFRTTTHPGSLTVRSTALLQAQVGLLAGSVERPVFRLQASGAGQNQIVQDDSGHFVAPVTFASVALCAQDMSVPIWSRRCVGSAEFWKWLPHPTIGVPLNASLFQGNAFFGLSMPYVPYVSVVGGVQLASANQLRIVNGTQLQVGDNVQSTSLEQIQEARLRVGAFVGITVTSDILGLFQPAVRPAQ